MQSTDISLIIKMLIKDNARAFIAFVLIISGFGCVLLSFLGFKSQGASTILVDMSKDGDVTVSAYLSTHPWRNVSNNAGAIRAKLRLDEPESTKLEMCYGTARDSQGEVQVQPYVHGFVSLEAMHPQIHGRMEPETCRSRQKVAIVVPHRDRARHLSALLNNLIPFLQRQQTDFTIIVVNQAHPSTFNRAMLFNIGFLEASAIHPYDCFIFHDVDLLPLDDRNLYGCGLYPRHVSVAIDKFRFRVHGSNMIVVRYPAAVSRYSMIKHDRDPKNGKNVHRNKLLETSVQRMYEDGLNTLRYKRLSLQLTKLFLWIDVAIDEHLIWKGFVVEASVSTGSNEPPFYVMKCRISCDSTPTSHWTRISKYVRMLSRIISTYVSNICSHLTRANVRNRSATLAMKLTTTPPTHLQCCRFGALFSKQYSHDQGVLHSPLSFENVLSEDNRRRVQKRLKYEIPVRTEKHVPLKPNHSHAAVLVPLCTVNGEPSVLLMLRSRKLVKYRGHVSFPGGNVDGSDPDVEFTALRETHEELGIEPSAFRVWGHMNPLPASQDGGQLVHPILACTGELDTFKLRINDEEVEEAFPISIRHLCNPDNVGSTRFRIHSKDKRSYTLPVYLGAQHRVWGLTATVMHMLLNILAPNLYSFKLRHRPQHR